MIMPIWHDLKAYLAVSRRINGVAYDEVAGDDRHKKRPA